MDNVQPGQVLQGQVSNKGKITDDPRFYTFSRSEQKQFLGAIDPRFNTFSPEDQDGIIEGLHQHYKEKLSTPMPDMTNSPGQLFKDTGAAIMNTSAGALNGLSLGLLDFRDNAHQAGQAIGATPEVANDTYGAANIGGNIAGALPMLPALAQRLGAGGAAVAASTIPNAASVVKGEQNIPQALTQTGIDLATNYIPGSKSIIGNAVKQGAGQGAGGFISSLIGNATNGQKFDYQEAIKNALLQAGIGAAMGGSTHAVEHPGSARKLKNQFDPSRKAKFEQVKQERTLQAKLRNTQPHQQMTVEDYYRQKAQHLYDTDKTASKTAFNAVLKQHKRVTESVAKRQAKYGERYSPSERDQEALHMHRAMDEITHNTKVKTKETAKQKTQQDRLDLDNQKTSNKIKVEETKQKTAEAKESAKTKPIKAQVELEQAKQKTIQAREEHSAALAAHAKARAELKAAQEAKASKDELRAATEKVQEARDTKKQTKKSLDEAKTVTHPKKEKATNKDKSDEPQRESEQPKGKQPAKGKKESKAPDKQELTDKQKEIEDGLNVIYPKQEAQPAENTSKYKTKAQEAHPAAKTLIATLKSKQAKEAFDNLPADTQKTIKEADASARQGNRVEIYDYKPKTGELSSNETGINTEGGKKDKLVTPIGWEFNPRSKEFKLHAINHNFEHRTYIMRPSVTAEHGLNTIVKTDTPGLVGKYHNVYHKPGQHVDLNQHISTAIKSLPESDLAHLLSANGDVTKIQGVTRKRLRETLNRTGAKQEEIYNHVQETLSNIDNVERYLHESVGAKIEAKLIKSKKKVDAMQLELEIEKDSEARKIMCAIGQMS